MARRLSSEKIRDIIELYEKGLSMRSIAEKLDISVGVVHKYIDRYRRGLLNLEEIKASRASSVEVMDDLRYMWKLRTMKENPKLPILYEELRTQSWWHRLVFETGIGTVLLVLASMDVPEERLADKVREWREDPSKLGDEILDFLSKAVKLRKDIARMRKLEEENEKLSKLCNKLIDALLEYKEAYETLIQMVPSNIQARFMAWILIKQILTRSQTTPTQKHATNKTAENTQHKHPATHQPTTLTQTTPNQTQGS